jgi:hypothetical protein
MGIIDIDGAPVDWPALIDRIHRQGEAVLLKRNGAVLAELRPVPPAIVTTHDLLEMLRKGPHLDADDAAAFARDLEDSRRELEALGVRQTWDS